jgi:spore maturation protein CgeB
MRVLYYIPVLGTTGADRWIYEGWRFAFADLGHEFFELTLRDDWRRRLDDTRPDLLFIANRVNVEEHRQVLLWARERGTRVFLIVDWPMGERDLRVLRAHDVADVFFGEREPESMREFEAATGRRYHLIPNAANRRWHYPAPPVARYAYDIVYLGAYLPKKRKMFREILAPLARRYRCGIFGPYWTLRDNALRGAQRVFRSVGWFGGAAYVNRLRIVIPPEEEHLLYGSAKICVNFHEREDDGSQPHYIVNQRAFKIPACGGFQLCDDVPALRKYFAEDEVAVAGGPDDWFRKIDHYLRCEAERTEMRRRGTDRALRDHTYHRRVEMVLSLCRPAAGR